MTTNDNEFIAFMEKKQSFTNLLHLYTITLCSLFVSLILGIIAYEYFDYFVKTYDEKHLQSKYYLLFFELLFSYSLVATALCAIDSIKFTKYRSLFNEIKDKKSKIPQ